MVSRLDTGYVLAAILVMALVTYIPRVLPLTVFQGKIKSRFLRNFLQYVPYAALGAMTFPGIFYATENMLCALLGTAVAIVAAFFGGSLLVVAICAVLAVIGGNLFLV